MCCSHSCEESCQGKSDGAGRANAFSVCRVLDNSICRVCVKVSVRVSDWEIDGVCESEGVGGCRRSECMLSVGVWLILSWYICNGCKLHYARQQWNHFRTCILSSELMFTIALWFSFTGLLLWVSANMCERLRHGQRLLRPAVQLSLRGNRSRDVFCHLQVTVWIHSHWSPFILWASVPRN